jgi:small GTP-binding protein
LKSSQGVPPLQMRKRRFRGRKIKLQLWDTAGQEKFRAVTKSYYRNSLAVFLVMDITRRDTYNHLGTWLQDCRSLTSSDTYIVLVGNKLDLDQERQVSFEEASKFADQNKLTYIETSAKTGKNIEDAFYSSANKIFEIHTEFSHEFR